MSKICTPSGWQVADVCVEALVLDEAEDKVCEIVSQPGEPARPLRTLFAALL